MKTITKEELARFLEDHGKWSRGESGGVRINLRGASLRGADMSFDNLSDADLRDLHIPVVEQLDVKVLAAIEAAPDKFDMYVWHGDGEGRSVENGAGCGTTHCRAGWAIHIAGKPGYDLERIVGPMTAGTLIYQASTGNVPCFTDTNEYALADIRRCAAEQLAKSSEPEP